MRPPRPASPPSARNIAGWLWIIALLPALLLAPRAGAASDETNSPARIKVSGYGLLGNRELQKTIMLLHTYKDPDRKPAVLNADFLEDSALIILSLLAEKGYLESQVVTTVTHTDGAVTEQAWTQDLDTRIPRDLAATAIHFQVVRGVLFHYDTISFEGLQTIPESRAMNFFIETGTLVRLKSMRIYTPSRLRASLDNLAAALARQGYAEATTSSTNLVIDSTSGRVHVKVLVRQGLPSIVRSVRTITPRPDLVDTNVLHPDAPYSRVWVQDFVQGIRTNHYKQGFPDVSVSVSTTNREETAKTIHLDLAAEVEPGPHITLGEVHFEGVKRTRLRTLLNRVELDPGESLNTLEVEAGRHRLSRLGVFETVGVRYDEVKPGVRDATYEVQEGKVIDFSLLLGYGSYELLRGGFELEQHNALGRAHQSRLRGLQSFKATSGDYLYSIPELFHDVSAFFNASALLREEISFDREEYAVAVGAQRFFPSIRSDLTVSYNYELLTASELGSSIPGTGEKTRVSAIELDLKHDDLDNPLVPRRGYRVYSNLELASGALGGEVDFQRLELGGALHFRIGRAQYLHAGISHGILTTYGGSRSSLPVNKRFFPGGENSVRGFQLGEAAPRDAEGTIVGAEVYLQGNLELEQVLTPSWSLVGFLDGVGIAEDIADYPFSDQLYSAGLGIRWKTFIGPARLEYGRNLNPRTHDPDGTLHFSIGFPF